MSLSLEYSQIETTFVASIRSVGTACTLAAVGIYLHRRGFVVGEGKRTLALISQQVTIPLFLFTKVIYCNQDWSDDPCPDIIRSLKDVWLLLLWPAYVVFCGLMVGYVSARLAGTPPSQIRSVLAACAFANSTGLPITLLTVVHVNFPSTTELGRIDPTLFLSVYLLTYPMLQWSIGGWLLAPGPASVEQDELSETDPSGISQTMELQRSASTSLGRNVLNNKDMENWYKMSRRGIGETDASMYISSVDLEGLSSTIVDDDDNAPEIPVLPSTLDLPPPPGTESSALLLTEDRQSTRTLDYDTDSLCGTFGQILKRVLQPPVIGAMAGIFVAATPLRGVFVDLVDRNSSAPLQWMFDALYVAGLAAVPLNMMILGINLSQSQLSTSSESVMLSSKTMASIVFGKMLIMPMIGVGSVLICKKFLLNIPEDIDASFYLVMAIVFITPTANNVMVMVELSGGGAKEGIARVIAWEYAIAPIVLSLTMTTAVGIASQWS